MKKILFTLLICLLLVGCQKEVIENPMYECESLEEINKIANTHLVKPNAEVEKEKYYMMDNNTSEYIYYLNNLPYYMRGTKDTTIDMSGVFSNGVMLFQNKIDETIAYGEAEGYKVYRFILADKQYIFGVEDNEKLDKETFTLQFNEIYKQIMYDSTLDEIIQFIGEYADQRAKLTIELTDVNTLLFNIEWSNSATSQDVWNIICKSDGEKFVYKKENVEHQRIEYLNDGTEKIESIQDYGDGCFKYIDNKLVWEDSESKQTPICTFERIN